MQLALALLMTVAGLACLAASMTRHWRQLRGAAPLARPTALALRLGGGMALVMALALCLATDHASMAALVFIMLLAVGAVIVALGFGRVDRSR